MALKYVYVHSREICVI